MTLPAWFKHLILLFGITFVYIFAGKFGLTLAIVNPSASPVWAPTGIALAAVLLFGYRVYPAILVGAFIVNVTTAGSIGTSIAIAIGNTLEALVGAYLVNEFANGKYALNRVADLFKFAIFATGFSTMVSATIGVTTLAVAGLAPWSDYGQVWFTWWLGDAGGSIVVAPFILSWAIGERIAWTPRRIIEFLGSFFLLIFSGVLVFTEELPYPYLTIPSMVWIAFRLSQREAATGVLLLTIMATISTLSGYGPFVQKSGNLNQSLLYLQLFAGTVSLTALSLAAALVERKQTIERSEQRFRALIENSYDGVNLVDASGTIVYSSPANKRILGYTQEELVGSNGFDLVHEEDKERTQKVLARLISEPNKTVSVETRLRRKDGKVIWTENTATNLLDEPSVRAVVVNFHDITRDKEIDKMKSEFLSVAAHQLRTPLGTMRWNIELLLAKESVSDEVKEKVKSIYEDNQRMIMWVNDLLNVSRIEQGRFTDQPSDTDVRALVEKIIEEEEPHAKKKSVTVTIESSGVVPMMFIDGRRLRDVLQNVIGNAIKYNKQGGLVTVAIAHAGDFVTFTISDTGVGIPKDDVSRIFEKFFRATNVRESYVEGTGLGLYVTRSYVEAWGGTIHVDSTEGKGTTVAMRLPLKSEAKRVQ